MTNFERGVKIPLIIRAPWMVASIGQTSRALVEMVDVCEFASSIAAASACHAADLVLGVMTGRPHAGGADRAAAAADAGPGAERHLARADLRAAGDRHGQGRGFQPVRKVAGRRATDAGSAQLGGGPAGCLLHLEQIPPEPDRDYGLHRARRGLALHGVVPV